MKSALEDYLANLRAYLRQLTPGSAMHQAVTEAIRSLERDALGARRVGAAGRSE